ncbi:MAG: hypothetical protein QOD45_49, partial [Pseudonocardiales bacterium]|nr:hypothetical protein [Pseudonocardiales bacterium]
PAAARGDARALPPPRNFRRTFRQPLAFLVHVYYIGAMGQDGERVAAALSDAVDALLAAPIARYPRDELLALLRDVDTQLRRLAAVDAVLVGEIDQRHTAAELGAANTSVLLSQLLRIAPGEAAARLRAARDLAPRRGLTGEALAPIFPAVAQALAAGELNPAHARLIGKTIDAIPAEVEQAALGRGEHLAEQVEATLVHQAGRLDLRQLGHLATRLLAHLDPDGAAPADEQAQRRRSLALYPRPDGSGQLRGELTPETVAVWRTILDALSRPAPESDNLPDPRTGGQRRHDALLDAGQRLLRAGDIPDAGGTPVTLLITLTDQQLATGQGYAVTEHGELLPAGTAIRLADQAALTTCQLTATGGILDYGTSRRLATPGMRRALAPRPRLHLPRLHRPRLLVPDPSRDRLAGRRPDQPGQPHPALRPPPPHLRTQRLDLPDELRPTALDTTPLARPPPHPTAQHRPAPPSARPHRTTHHKRHRAALSQLAAAAATPD